MTILLQGKAIGISIGCVLGMFPLLYYKQPKKDTEDKETSTDDESDST